MAALGQYRLLPILTLLAWMGLILFLSSRSSLPAATAGSPSPVDWMAQYQDEVGHLGEYAVLGVLAYAALRPRLGRGRCFLLGLAFCVAFALADEAFQGLIPNRTPQATDLFLDAVGATAALVFMAALGPGLKRHLRRRTGLEWPGRG